MTPSEIAKAVEFAKLVESNSGAWSLNDDRARQLAAALLALAERCGELEKENFDLRTAVMEMHSLRLNVEGAKEALWRLRQAANKLDVPFDFAAALDAGKEQP